MGDEAPLGAVKDDVSKCHIAGYHRLDRDQLSLADAGIHASAAGPEAHRGASTQQLSGQIQKYFRCETV